MSGETDLQGWFCREVLPLEAALTRFIRRNWRNESDIIDLRQEVYERVLEGASRSIPLQAKAFVFTVARNHLINCAKRAQIISFEVVADLESSTVAMDVMTPERHLTARDELRRVQAGLDRLPPRCREVVRLRKIEGLSTRETAERLGVGIDTVEQQTVHGMRALVDFMLGGTGKIQRGGARKALARPS